MKRNCWEFKGCGRELNGANSTKYGVCPAAIEKRLDGIHDGKNAGRACWAVVGTMCCDREDKSFAEKFRNCRDCEFYNKVISEEGPNFIFSFQIHGIMNNSFSRTG